MSAAGAVVNLKLKSTAMDWARYDPETQVLEIDFIKSGAPGKSSTYEYQGFSEADWDAFQRAESPASWFAKNVRYAKNADGGLKYPFKRIR